MTWIKAHQPTWRIIILGILLLALIGPWAYDRIHVPSEYPCLGSVRLEGDFCGISLPGIKLLLMGFGTVIGSIGRAAFGGGELTQEFRSIAAGMVIVLLFIPIFSLLIMSVVNRSRLFRRSHIVFLILAVSAGAYLVVYSFSQRYWGLWGIWLYLGSLLLVIGLEILNYLDLRRIYTAG